jgi:preprotein translocase subunit SecD
VSAQDADAEALDRVRRVLEQRLTALELDAELVVEAGAVDISVESLGELDRDRVTRLLLAQETVTFRPVVRVVEGDSAATPTGERVDAPACDRRSSYAPDDPKRYVIYCERARGEGWTRLLLAPTELTGSDVREARMFMDLDLAEGGKPEPVVDLGFLPAGGRTFDALTRDLARAEPPRNQLAIVVDQLVRASPRVSTHINYGEAIISGFGNERETKALARMMEAGSLPVPLRLVEATSGT